MNKAQKIVMMTGGAILLALLFGGAIIRHWLPMDAALRSIVYEFRAILCVLVAMILGFFAFTFKDNNSS
jgi:hypothetical protein